MPTRKQLIAWKKNIKKAQAARSKKTAAVRKTIKKSRLALGKAYLAKWGK